ncbi:MAG TPA: glycosyltransferase family 39 protein [Candidatus Dormibacteraeota bacterium]|nr:glycosyltransferase family 39 protein [Candidatus Dormibacteraeota bacterium]
MPQNSVAAPHASGDSAPAKSDWLSRLDSGLHEHSTLIAGAVVLVGVAWRLWLARATFFNTDEAWHFFLANQSSAWMAYKASLTISHPPLLILILHFWRVLGTSNLMLRLPAVIAGSVFCWFFYKWLDLVAGRAAAWAGLILAVFLGPMIATSADVRQNPLLLMFSAGAVYVFDRALEDDSALAMLGSTACLCLAMLSHYSAFFVAGALGVYAIVRMLAQRPSSRVMLAWVAGQSGGVALAGLLYKTHLGRLGSILNQGLLPQQYLSGSYFHEGADHLVPYLYRGTFGIFRFFIGQTQIGQLAAILFVAGVIFLFARRDSEPDSRRRRALGILLLLPFVLNWLAAAEGLYPYGRMRQCMFLVIFGLAGVSICLARIANQRTFVAATWALGIVLLAHVFGTLQDRDAIPLADQRHEHMDQMLQFIRSNVGPNEVIFTDQATSFQLRHYLCDQKPVAIDTSHGLEEFRCEGFHVGFTGPNFGALDPDNLHRLRRDLDHWSSPSDHVWVVQGGWASGLGETLQGLPAFAQLDVHTFGKYLEIFRFPTRVPRPA